MRTEEFNHIILPMRSNLKAYALRLTESDDNAEDLVQEVMLRLWDMRQNIQAILLAVSGVGLLYQGDGNDKLSTAGFALVMCSSLLYALYIISINQWKNPGMSNIKFTFYILVFGLLTMFVYSFIAGEPIQMLQTPKQWLCAAQLALLPTVLSLFFMTISINLIGSTPAAIMGALEPVTAAPRQFL